MYLIPVFREFFIFCCGYEMKNAPAAAAAEEVRKKSTLSCCSVDLRGRNNNSFPELLLLLPRNLNLHNSKASAARFFSPRHKQEIISILFVRNLNDGRTELCHESCNSNSIESYTQRIYWQIKPMTLSLMKY